MAKSSVARPIKECWLSLAIWLNFCFTALYSGVSLPFNAVAILCPYFREHQHNFLLSSCGCVTSADALCGGGHFLIN